MVQSEILNTISSSVSILYFIPDFKNCIVRLNINRLYSQIYDRVVSIHITVCLNLSSIR